MADQEAQDPTDPKEEPRAATPPPAEAEKAPKGAEAPAEAPKPAEPADEKPAEQPAADEKPADEPAEQKEEAKEDEEPAVVAPPLPAGKDYIWGTGRRKRAVARVRIRPGTGKFLVNKREADEYFNHDRDRNAIRAPLEAIRMLKGWDVWVNVGGGGYTGQAGAVLLGLARALAKAMPEVESALRDQGLMTRDARMSERKKPGQPGARKRFQFSKR